MPGDLENKDRFLLAQVADGDRSAFGRLYKIYQPDLYSFLFQLSRSETDAEDGVHDIFLSIWKNREILRSVQNFRGYIFNASRNYFLNLVKKNSRTTHPDNFHELSLPATGTPEEILKHKELVAFLKKTVSELPEQQRRAYTMQRDEKLKISEIADRMKLSVHTVKEHLQKAKMTIQIKYDNYIKLLLALVYWGIFKN